MITYLRLILLSTLSSSGLVRISSLQAMDNPYSEMHDLRQGQNPAYITKSETFVTGTSKFKYTISYKPPQNPTSFSTNNPQQNKLPKVPHVIEDGLVAKVTEEELKSFKHSSASGIDTRHEIEDPSGWPYCVHGHLMMRFGAEEIVVGSGILVGPNHVLTAGHNLYNRTKRQWPDEVWFSPGRRGKNFPFGYSKGSILLCHKEWLDHRGSKKDDYDLGMIILDRAIGNEAGWSGLLYAPDIFFDQWEIAVTGYPGEKGSKDYYSTQMWEKGTRAKNGWFSSEVIQYDIPTSFGQSGGAIWRQWPTPVNPDPTNILTIGIHTQGGTNGTNKGIRLTKKNLSGLPSG
ncbi:trypsin-like serine peptidase [Candidatus Paracaedibacter symbiosus]|uniref:trypsin-like serine peptidase n=1 Tax=Candidatus Paracaedibacter symbiosus TaxID=244582 RepID=UPI0005098153|nr:trypsin-like serine protease [Candidatus Paracaedibacter symbiosus]